MGERTFFPDPKTGSAVGWPARIPPPFLRLPVAPSDVADLQRMFFSLLVSWQHKSRTSDFVAASDVCDLPRVTSTVLDPRPGVAPMPRCAGPSQHGVAVCGAMRLFSSAALRLRLDVRLPLPLPAEACRPRDGACFSLLHVSLPGPAPRAPAQPGLLGLAARCVLLRVSGAAGPRPRVPALLQGSAPVEPATIPHAVHWVPALPWDASRPSGSAAGGYRRSGSAALWTPPLSRTCVHW